MDGVTRWDRRRALGLVSLPGGPLALPTVGGVLLVGDGAMVSESVLVAQQLQRLGFVCRHGASGRTRALFQQDRWELEVYVHGSGSREGQWELVPWVGRRTRGVGADSLRRAVADRVGLERVLEQRLFEAMDRLTANGQEDRLEGLVLAWEGWLARNEPTQAAWWAAIQAEWDTEQQV